MSGAIPPVPHVISRHAQGHLHLIILKSLFCLHLSPLFDFQPSAYQCATNIIVALYYLTSVFHIQEAGDFSIKNRCDLANNNGEGQGGSTMSVRKPNVYAVSCKIQVFHSLLYLHRSTNLFENISIFFLFPRPQLSSLRKLFLGKEILEGHLSSLAPPQIMLFVFSVLNLF